MTRTAPTASAILPKVDIESVRRVDAATSTETVSQTVKALLSARAHTESDEERQRLDALIEKLMSRL